MTGRFLGETSRGQKEGLNQFRGDIEQISKPGEEQKGLWRLGVGRKVQ